jgi:GT2 family glycosyltransferase
VSEAARQPDVRPHARVDSLRAVVLSYGSGGKHGPLLASLLAEGLPAERILVVHNPALPGEPDPVLPAGVELLRNSHNLGYAAGMNRGIERQLERGCDLVLLLTHDARLRPGALAALLEAATAHPEFGLLGPALVFAGSERPFSFGGLDRGAGRMAHRRELPEAQDGIATCDWIDGGTMLVRAATLERVGRLDESLWSYYEEAELCLRARRGGFGVGVVLTAVADQAPGGLGRPAAWSYLMTRNGIAYASRADGSGGLLLASARAAFEALLELARVLARGLRLRRGSPTEPWALCVGTARGLLDFHRRRWGPPPTLPGPGDVSNVAPPDDGDRGG